MFKGRSKGRGRGRGDYRPIFKTPLKGLFSDGIWQCNCDPRLPAQHFQTKNGGKNHGRWCTYLMRFIYDRQIANTSSVQSILARRLSLSAVISSFGMTKLKAERQQLF